MGKGFVFSWKGLGWETGIEPATFGATGDRASSEDLVINRIASL